MIASREVPRRRPGLASVRHGHGALTLLLIILVLIMAVLAISSDERARFAPAESGGHALAEVPALPESPTNGLSAPEPRIGVAKARKLNAAIPFASADERPARPFQFVGSFADRARAADCLAIAAMAEAGGGSDGQRAVIQVILNRVLHPAFAKTICGVVFEGSHRASGCQFTFTCDGALARNYSADSWARARNRAFEALGGLVYSPVGLATHYHTDWVHPYWSDSLLKLTRVDTHLFFRWKGYWGDAALLARPYRGREPAITKLSYLPAHNETLESVAAEPVVNQSTEDMVAREMIVRNRDGGAFVLLSDAQSAASAREMGRSICKERPSCKVLGWFDRTQIPSGYPVSSRARTHLGFSYFRDAQSDEIVLYDCARFTGVSSDGCIPSVSTRRVAFSAEPAVTPLATTSGRNTRGGDGFSTSPRGYLQPP